MAAVVNERDVLMRAAAARVIDVTLPSNVTPTALKGLSLLAPTNYFRIATNGDPSPTGIELTVTLQGLPQDTPVTWAVTSGTATLTGTGLTRTLTAANMTTDFVVVSASVSVGGLTYEDSFAFSKFHDGSNGLPGARGSLSVARSIAGSSWSDAEALAALLAAGASGPVATDTCTLFNVPANYSEMRRYSGTTWIPVGPSVPGSVFMSNSITTEKLLVTGLGAALNSDPQTKDITAWTGVGVSIVSDTTSPSGTTVLKCVGEGTDVRCQKFPIDASLNYRVRGWYQQVSGGGTAYLYVVFFDASGDVISATTAQAGWANAGEYHYYGLFGQTPSATWTEYSTSFGATETNGIPAGAKYAAVGLRPNYSAVGETRVAGLICHQKTTGDMVVDGTLTASKIDTRQLSIKDGSGAVVISGGAVGGSVGKRLNLIVQDALAAGTFSPSTGQLVTGVQLGSQGIVGKAYGFTTFSLDQFGNAYFGGTLGAGTATFDSIVSASATSFELDTRVGGNGLYSVMVYMHHDGFLWCNALVRWHFSGAGYSYSLALYIDSVAGGQETATGNGDIGGGPGADSALWIGRYLSAGYHTIYLDASLSTANGDHVLQFAVLRSYR